MQVRFLLENYEPDEHEYPLAPGLIDGIVSVAKSLVDEPAVLSGQNIQLEEEPELHAQFIIPEDGYSVEVVYGVPPGLSEFLDPLCRNSKLSVFLQICLMFKRLFLEICEMSVHPFSQGLWTVYFTLSSGDRSPSVRIYASVVVFLFPVFINYMSETLKKISGESSRR